MDGNKKEDINNDGGQEKITNGKYDTKKEIVNILENKENHKEQKYI